MRIRPLLTLLLVALSLTPMALQHFALQGEARDALRASLSEKELASADALAERANSFVESLTSEIRAVAYSPAILYGRDEAEQADILNLLVSREPALLHIQALDARGHEMARASLLRSFEELGSHAGVPQFDRAMRGARVIEAPVLDRTTLEVHLTIWVPIELFPGEVRVVIRAVVRMHNLLESIAEYAPPGGGYAFVLSADRLPIAHPERATIVAGLTPPEASRAGAGTRLWDHPALGEVLVVETPITVTSWSVVVVRPTDEVFATLAEVGRVGTTIALVTGGLVVLLAGVFARQLTMPLRELDKATQRLAAGDLKTPVSTKARNEVGNFARAFEAMRKELHGLYAGLEEKVAERTRDLERARSQAADLNDLLTHDISNYVMPARESLWLLSRSKDLTEKDAARIATSMRGMDRIAELVENVRIQSRLEAGDEEAMRELRVVPLTGLLGDAASRVRDTYAGTEGLDICTACVDAQATVRASPLLVDVFLNLLTNAVKYSPAPHVEVGVVAGSLQGAPAWRIEVRDRGLGIPDDMKRAIFDRYRRLHRPIRGNTTGLGLTIAARVVQAHGGTIHVEDREPGDHTKGSIFVVTLPAERSPSA